MATFRDKALGLLLTAIGLAYMGWQHPTGAAQLLAGIVILGGLATVIGAQMVAALVRQYEAVVAPNGGSSGGSGGSAPSSASSPGEATIDQAR
jgi:uncharacterized membrane protein